MNLLFPAYCFHCSTSLEKLNGRLCSVCTEQLTLLEPLGRCIRCFEPLTVAHGTCRRCRETARPYQAKAACFSSIGPFRALLHAYQRGRRSLSKDFAAFLLAQIRQLEWPWPDLLVPVPFSWEERLFMGFDTHLQLVQELSIWTRIPFVRLLRKTGKVRVRGHINYADKTVLLLSLDQKGIDEAAEELLLGAPRSVYCLALRD